jgi:hypothetical protein
VRDRCAPVRGFASGLSRTFAISGPTFSAADGTAYRGAGRWTTPMVDTGWVLAAGNLTFDGTQDGFSLISSMNGSARSICDLTRPSHEAVRGALEDEAERLAAFHA